jgi:acetylornithine deacetylase/succinyl-diaminopimelate desuccinylase-like protein
LVKAASSVVPHATISTSKGSTDLCFFSDNSIPAIIFGPGEKQGIHSPNEFSFPKKIEKGANIIKKIISSWVKSKGDTQTGVPY